MSAPASLRSAGKGHPLRDLLFPWAIAIATGLDYFDSSSFSFFITRIAGGINASPDELVWASSAYAAASVAGILQQQWWVERIGYRRYISGSLLLFAAGSTMAILSESSLELAFARGFQGYFIGPMMSACRILLQVGFPAQRRASGTRLFLLMILLGSALAPLVGGYLVADFGWRALFACTAFAGAASASLAMFALPPAGKVVPEERGDAHLWPYLVFAFAQGALQISMQQVRFELYTASPELMLLTAIALLCLGWFGWHQWHHPKPLIRLHALRERTYQTGIALYVCYYYVSNALGYLVSRFLEGGLAYPIENAGTLVGYTSLASLAGAVIYFRYSARIARKKWLIVPGLMLAVAISAGMANMPPDVSMAWLAVPLVLRGLLLLLIALPNAGITFRIFSIDEYHNGYRLKNIVKQLTFSFSTATMIILDQHRRALHETRLTESVNVYNPQFQNTFDILTRAFVSLGRTVDNSRELALAEISNTITRQAAFLSTLDGFWFIAGVATAGCLFAVWQKQID
ncbi:DHA2 family multidrug resistance protein [Burkholderia sp. PvR073]|uniref:MFS transporter n=1 Tax=Burkholderia TaxID=32008 RepID=UPI00254EC5DE|nr:MFS transporter [Burkholderia sp. lyk4-R2A-23]